MIMNYDMIRVHALITLEFECTLSMPQPEYSE